MQSSAKTVKDYLAQLPEEKKEALTRLRSVLLDNLPEGFSEEISYGMLGYVVPHSKYPKGYHVTPEQPLPFIAVAAQKNFVALYHMGLYGDPALLKWFTEEYSRQVKTKLDMGKSCIRFKNPAHIPYELIGELASKITPDQWIERYEKNLKP